jgi:hypothetical protein
MTGVEIDTAETAKERQTQRCMEHAYGTKRKDANGIYLEGRKDGTRSG